MYSSTLSLTSALDGGGWSTPRPGRFTPREKSQVQILQAAGCPVIWILISAICAAVQARILLTGVAVTGLVTATRILFVGNSFTLPVTGIISF
jgi:hypothetical protein